MLWVCGWVAPCVSSAYDTIICGDLNARLGAITGDSVANARGSVLLRWCEEHGLSVLNSTLAPGVPTFLSYRGGQVKQSMIDYFLTNTTSALRSPRMQVYSDLSLGSDHKLLSLSFDYACPSAMEPLSVEGTRCL
ncbi:hypothetical protein G6F52_013795 [Rhizopus delemar]|nr:hypothetical protein G6F52_013795 [Rhizopus delemar]